MSYSYAILCYGFVIDKILFDKSLLIKGLDTVSHGNDEESNETVVCIKKSINVIHDYDELKPIKIRSYDNYDGWDSLLKKWAKENKIKKQKIGWHLCSSYC